MNAIEILKKQEETIKKKYSVEKIGVFGSFARGEETEGSDIDFLVEFQRVLLLRELGEALQNNAFLP